MNDRSSTEANNSQSSKQQETKDKLKLNVWLNSPLLVAIVSGLFGTGLGAFIQAAFQGYWNFQLERQKFEFSLIQESLEIEEGLIKNQNERQEAAKRLEFLVKSGIIKSLDSDSIEKLAKNPDDLPTFPRSESAYNGRQIRLKANISSIPCQLVSISIRGKNQNNDEVYWEKSYEKPYPTIALTKDWWWKGNVNIKIKCLNEGQQFERSFTAYIPAKGNVWANVTYDIDKDKLIDHP